MLGAACSQTQSSSPARAHHASHSRAEHTPSPPASPKAATLPPAKATPAKGAAPKSQTLPASKTPAKAASKPAPAPAAAPAKAIDAGAAAEELHKAMAGLGTGGARFDTIVLCLR